MSGVEAVGVVLAVIPLLISAFEHYNDSRRAISRFLKKKEYIKRVIEALDEQRVLIENELDHVLRLAGFGEDAENISWTQYQPLLERPDVAAGLETVLGRSYDPYIRAIRRCEIAVLEIARRLKGLMASEDFTLEDLADHAKKTKQSNGKFEFGKSLRVSLDVDDLQGRLKELDESTSMMSRLRISGQAVDETQSVSNKAQKRMLLVLENMRRHAESMYSALCQSWIQGCHLGHSANLYLPGPAKNLEKTTKYHFQVAFRATHAASGKEMPLLEELIDIHWLEVAPQNIGAGSKVKFTGVKQAQTLRPSQTHVEVKDLCDQLKQAQTSGKSLQLYLSEPLILRCCIQDRCGSPFDTTSMAHPLITLDQILGQFSTMKGNKRAQFWNTGQRMYLAATLASSILQLCSTPWLAQSWSRHNVFFHTCNKINPKTGGVTDGFEATHPFLVQNLHGNASRSSLANQNAKDSILELGILLLEIFDGRSIESRAQEAGSNLSGTVAARCLVAGEWLLDLEPEMLPKYRGATASCLDIASSKLQPVRLWKDPDLQKTLLETVVQPLITGFT